MPRLTMDGARLVTRDKIRGLLDDGRVLLADGRAHDALLAFERAALGEPDSAEVRAGLAAARAAVIEAERLAEERLAGARQSIAAGQPEAARDVLARLVAEGSRAAEAAALLETLAPGHVRFAAPPAEEPAALPSAAPAASRSRRRAAFAGACAGLFALLATGIALSWDGLIERLQRAPAPRSAVARADDSERIEMDATSRARRFMSAGRPAAALAALDTIPQDDPAWPLARQLRSQAESALRAQAEAAERR